MATRIYENVMILSQQPLATEILKSSFVDNISKRIFVFFLQWSKMANIQSSADHCFDSITMSSPSLLSPSPVSDAKETRKKRKWSRETLGTRKERYSPRHFFSICLRSRSTDHRQSINQSMRFYFLVVGWQARWSMQSLVWTS